MPVPHSIHQPCFLEVAILLTIALAAVSSWGQTPAAPKDSGPIPYLKLSEPRHILLTAQAWERNEFPHTMSVLQYNHDGFRYWGWYGLNEGEGIGRALSKNLKDSVKYEQNPRWTD